VENFLADLDAHGVRFGVIAAASLFGTYNEYSLQALRNHPRLRATANVDTGIDPAALQSLRAAGVVGIRLQWFFLAELPDMSGRQFQQHCRQIRDLGMHVHLNIRGDRLVEVASKLAATGVNLVIDHFGWHDPAPRLAAPSYQGMLRLLEHDNVWVKLTSGYRHPDEHFPDWSLPVEYAQDLLHRFGPVKLMWGSDAPFIGHEHVASYGLAIDRFRQCVPDASMRAAIGDNGYRFYFGGE
jgi:predicted TIM-barrel fold metal-dependent hydrolase